jgi:lipopolysaccharide export system protein LptA
MTRSLLIVCAALAALLVLPGAAEAQQRCQQVLPSDLRRMVDAAGNEMIYYRNPVRFLCSGGVEIEADSAAMNSTAQTVELVGSVRYQDGDRQLTAEWARFLARGEELFARDNVILTDLSDGSVITGDDFEYYTQTEQRPESRMIMRGRRPHASLRPAPAPGADPAATPGEPTLVWARRMELIGETIFLAQTDVEIQRGDLVGAAELARFDQAAETMTLTGAAHVETDDYRLDGERIEARMPGNVIHAVTSDRNATLAAEDLTVRGEMIRIGFENGEPEQVEAWTPADRDQSLRAVAISPDFRLRADSIDARSENGRLRRVTAVGTAYGERAADTLSVHLPEALSRDWIQGDTIVAFFVDPAEADLASDAREPQGVEDDPESEDAVVPRAPAQGTRESDRPVALERIEVTGTDAPALSLYRSVREGTTSGPSINFMAAKRITLFMSAGEVSRVEADGPLEGMYLDPTGAPRRTPEGEDRPNPTRAAR